MWAYSNLTYFYKWSMGKERFSFALVLLDFWFLQYFCLFLSNLSFLAFYRSCAVIFFLLLCTPQNLALNSLTSFHTNQATVQCKKKIKNKTKIQTKPLSDEERSLHKSLGTAYIFTGHVNLCLTIWKWYSKLNSRANELLVRGSG